MDSQEDQEKSALMINFGKRLRTLRKRAHLTQGYVAEKADISERSINNLEKGRKGAKFNTLEKLANALDVQVYELFTFDE